MGWIERTANGDEIEHRDLLTMPDAGQVIDGSDIERWWADGAPGASTARTGCSCGWIDPAPAPPRLPDEAVGWDRVEAALARGRRLGEHVLDPGPPPIVAAWVEHHIHTWWRHLAREVPGTNADDPLNWTRSAVALLLARVEERPHAALEALDEAEAAALRKGAR